MDTRELTEILRATIDPRQAVRMQAEEQLAEIQKIIGFAPSLLQCIMQNEVPSPVKQAGVVYLKNLVTKQWHEKELEEGEPIPFHVHEQDRAMIRDMIVEAIVQATDMLRVQLCVCLNTMIKHDFPTRWSRIVDKIHIYLQNNEPKSAMGALLCLYQLTKVYERQPPEKRGHLIEAMHLLLPMIYNLIVNLQADQSMQSVLIQKQILKCYYSLIKYYLPLDLITKEVFTMWMEVLRSVLERPVPEHVQYLGMDERRESPWWKCKKWAGHTLCRLFERYGSPVNAREEYIEFSEWYLTTFTGGILEVLLKILDQSRQKVYISPRVLHQTITYIEQCVSHAHSWKLLKPHMFAIIQDVLFPLMSYSEADSEYWSSEPQDYIRNKFDIFLDFASPVTAAQSLLVLCCKKRKDMLEHTMYFCMQVLTDQEKYGPEHKDGALHMLGTLKDILIKKKLYRDQIETLLSQHVFPEFHSQLDYMRARACWIQYCFAGVRFKSEQILIEAIHKVVNCLLNDSDLLVKVEAAIAIKTLLSSQEKARKMLEPQAKAITTELLHVIRQSENDNVANVLQKIVPKYTEQLMPMADEIMGHLATTFSNVIETDCGTDEKALAGIGLLNTMLTVLNVMEDNPVIMAKLEKIVLPVVGHILHHNIIEYYAETMNLLCILTAKTISEEMWKGLEMLYTTFESEGRDYFTGMMPVLHNYITVDTNAFLSNDNNLLAMYSMARDVLSSNVDEESHMYAAKLLEVIVLQCSCRIDYFLRSFVEVVMSRLIRKVERTELRTMLMQVLIAIFYSSPRLLFAIFNSLQQPGPIACSISRHFVIQLIGDAGLFMGLHDRKLCVLGICTLLDMGPQRPSLDVVMSQILPSCLVLFDGLKRAYEARAEFDAASSSKEGDGDDDEEVLSTDDDDLDHMNSEYLENLSRMASKKSAQQDINMAVKNEEFDSDDDEDDAFEPDETILESYTTPLDNRDYTVDEYVKFKDTMFALSTNEPELYHALTSVLSEQQQKQLSTVFVLADLRRAQRTSKLIELSGGYSFTVPEQVPTTFKFGQ